MNSRGGRSLCALCRKRATGHKGRDGRYTRDRQHDICAECWDSCMSRNKAAALLDREERMAEREGVPQELAEYLRRRINLKGIRLVEVQEEIERHPQHVVARQRYGPLLPLAELILDLTKEP